MKGDKTQDSARDGSIDPLQSEDPWLVQTVRGNRPVSVFPPPGISAIEKIEPKRAVTEEELDFVEQVLSESAEEELPEPSRIMLAGHRARRARVPWMPRGKGCGCCSAGSGLGKSPAPPVPLAPPEGQMFYETKPMPDVDGARFNFGLIDNNPFGGPPWGT